MFVTKQRIHLLQMIVTRVSVWIKNFAENTERYTSPFIIVTCTCGFIRANGIVHSELHR
jgi:hypothetical protein